MGNDVSPATAEKDDILTLSLSADKPGSGQTWSEASIMVGPKAATDVTVSGSTITAKMPQLHAGCYSVSVSLRNGGTAVGNANSSKKVSSRLRFDDIGSYEGSLAGGSILSIQGVGFPNSTEGSMVSLSTGREG